MASWGGIPNLSERLSRMVDPISQSASGRSDQILSRTSQRLVAAFERSATGQWMASPSGQRFLKLQEAYWLPSRDDPTDVGPTGPGGDAAVRMVQTMSADMANRTMQHMMEKFRNRKIVG